MRISPAVSVEFLYRDLEEKVPPRVDCTVLFAGPHLEQILTAYAEAVRLFSEIHEPAKLLEARSGFGEYPKYLRKQAYRRQSLYRDARGRVSKEGAGRGS